MKNNNDISKFLSFVLRHDPQSIQLDMDAQGWVSIDQLIVNARQLKGIELSIETINDIVASNAKQRFKISEDKFRIKANQGHSIEVDLALTPSVPPAVLYHGTASRFLDAILHDGLKPMARHHVHLSESIETALAVGKRYGKAVLLCIDAQQMSLDGIVFYMTENKVWLVDAVPEQYMYIDQSVGSRADN